ncbi:MAG TPA: hypothetical protein VNN80_20605 [Polyangiaceae bacterium]|nr:hypothetical protein [Polyangiaceae bacterium]
MTAAPRQARAPHAVAAGLCLLLSSSLPPGVAKAEEQAPEPDTFFDPSPELFLERSYIVWGAPPTGPAGKDPALIFEAGVAPHFFIYQGLSKRLASGVSGFAWALPFTFETTLRMFAVKSSPVRMPSYMPRIRAQLFYVWAPTNSDRERRARSKQPLSYQILGLNAGLNHHSNGQEGCRYQSVVADQTQCVDAEISPDSSELAELLNRRSADFATTYLSLAVDYQWGKLGPNDYIDHSWELGVQAEAHPVKFLVGGMDQQTADTYGQLRIRLRGEATQSLGRWKLREQLNGTGALGGGSDVFPLTLIAEGAATRPDHGGLGAIVRVVYGRDYYNAFFVDENFQFQIGVTFDTGSPIHFEPPAASAGNDVPPGGMTPPTDPFVVQ